MTAARAQNTNIKRKMSCDGDREHISQNGTSHYRSVKLLN